MTSTDTQLSQPAKIVSWILQSLAALILLQTLRFKFTGADESKFIFESIGAEPWGRWGSGIIELLASALMFFRKYIWLGAAMALGTMVGAIMTHLMIIGIDVMGDGGLLFGMALTVFASCAIILLIRRREIDPMGLLNKSKQ